MVETPPVDLLVPLLRIKITIEDHRITTTIPQDEDIIVAIPGIRLLIKIPDLKWIVTTVAAMDIMLEIVVHPAVNKDEGTHSVNRRVNSNSNNNLTAVFRQLLQMDKIMLSFPFRKTSPAWPLREQLDLPSTSDSAYKPAFFA